MPHYTSNGGATSPGKKRCSLCRAEYTGWGHNADPFPGRCCDDCNEQFVTPARFARLRKWLARDARRNTTS
jgi:hypothetical protein